MVFSEQTRRKIKNRIRFIKLESFFNKIAQLPYVLVKGEALSIQAYGEVGKRNYSDIDILIDTKDIYQLELILQEEGFTNNTENFAYKDRKKRIINMLYSHQIAPYLKKINEKDTIEIDINFDIYWGNFDGKKNRIDSLLNRAVDCEIYGCKVKILPPLEAALQLILHNYKDLNSIFHLINRGGVKAYLYWDIYYLIKRNQINLNDFYFLCKEWDAIPYAYYMFYYIYELSKDKEIYKFLQAFICDEGKILLEYYGLDKRFQKKWEIGFYERLENSNIVNYLIEEMNQEELEQLKKEYMYY